MPAYRARPRGAAKVGAAKGGVVVVQEAWGVNGHIEDVTRRFAAGGWDAVAPAYADADHGFHCTADRPSAIGRRPGWPGNARSAGSTGTRPRRSWL
jgi:dienelactone hydrolase